MLLNFLIIPSNKQGIPRSSRSRNMKRTTLGGTVIPVTESTRPVHCMAVCWYRTAGTQVGGTPQYPQGSPQEPCEGEYWYSVTGKTVHHTAYPWPTCQVKCWYI